MAVSPSNQLVSLDQAILPVRGMLAGNMKSIGAALGSYMPPERFLSAVMTLCRHNPDLTDPRKASPQSLLLSVLRVAHLQLSPDPALGQAWIIPRKGKAEFQLGWKGALALAYRSSLVAAVRYGVVGPADRFVWRDGAEWVLEHEPSEEGWPEKLGDVRASWCIIELRTGRSLPRVMYRPEIIRHKERGSGSQPAWVTDPAAMSVKTVIADGCRRGPFEAEIGRAFALDFMGEIGKGQPASEEERAITVEIEDSGAPEGGKPKPSDRFKAAHRTDATPDDALLDAEIEGARSIDDTAAGIMAMREAEASLYLDPEQVLALRAAASQAGVPWSRIEEMYGGPMEEFEAQRGAEALYQSVMLDIESIAAQRDAEQGPTLFGEED